MALRPIDNALPTAIPERHKKQVKGSVPPQKQHDFGVNHENKAPFVPCTDATIDYISTENLKAIPDPESEIQERLCLSLSNGSPCFVCLCMFSFVHFFLFGCLLEFQSLIEGLDSKDWTKVCESLNNARRFALHHSSLLQPILEKVMLVVVKAMKNPRSALSKTSIMAASDIFNAFGDKLLDSNNSNAFDSLLLQLQMKASQDKKFVCEEADRALNTMVEFTTPLLLLHKIKPYVKHTNPRVRSKAAISISKCASKMGLQGMKEFGLVSLAQMAAELLKDRLPEAREAARSTVISTYNAFSENEEQKQEAWQNFCQSNLPPMDAQAMVKIITSL